MNDLSMIQFSGIQSRGEGDDKYILSPHTLGQNSDITILDSSGMNTIQLIDGLSITESLIASNGSLKLTFSNGAQITLLNTEYLQIELFGDPLLGVPGTLMTVNDFIANHLIAQIPESGIINGVPLQLGEPLDNNTQANYAPGEDVFIAQYSGIISKGDGNDTYLLSPETIEANSEMTILDSNGINKIQLIHGLNITESLVASNGSVKLKLDNGATVTLLGSENLQIEVGGNPTTGNSGTTYSVPDFISEYIGVTIPTTGVTNGNVFAIDDPIDQPEPTPEPIEDDYAADTSTTGAIEVGQSVSGNIETANDIDWFKVSLEAGQIYQINLEGGDSKTGAISDPYFSGVYDSEGVMYADSKVGTSSSKSGTVYPSLEFIAPETGEYFLAADGSADATGSYQLNINATNDDYAANTFTSGTLEVGSSATGSIEQQYDNDWFKVSLDADTIYTVTIKGIGDNSLYTASPISSIALYNSQGGYIDSGANLTYDDNSNSDITTQLFAPGESGDFFIEVNGNFSHQGDYEISIEETENIDGFESAENNLGLAYTLVSEGNFYQLDFDSESDVTPYKTNHNGDLLVTTGQTDSSYLLDIEQPGSIYSLAHKDNEVYIEGDYTDVHYIYGYWSLDLANQTTEYFGTSLDGNLPASAIPSDDFWFVSHFTATYGWELYKASYDENNQLQYELIKDINPGSTGSYPGGFITPLSNGNVVFAAKDGTHGAEIWVSDGTTEGTQLIMDLHANYSSYPSQLTQFKDWVVFDAWVDNDSLGGYLGDELVFTDGTTDGTFAFDINTEQYSWRDSNPTILGVAADHLYFTATAKDNEGLSERGIYKTDGATFELLSPIYNSATLLGWSEQTAYFNVSDAEHGNELWAADLVGDQGFYLVKDILPGTGAALTSNIDAQMLGDKVLFKAYTDDTTQTWMLSDGSEAGTFEIANVTDVSEILVRDSQKIVYQNSDDSIVVATVAENLVTNETLASNVSNVQQDSDQAFFLNDANDLIAYNFNDSSTETLLTGVNEFKVYQDDVIYATQATENDFEVLWFSEGTAESNVEVGTVNGELELSGSVVVATDSWLVA